MLPPTMGLFTVVVHKRTENKSQKKKKKKKKLL
jgi:hypothetical protein